MNSRLLWTITVMFVFGWHALLGADSQAFAADDGKSDKDAAVASEAEADKPPATTTVAAEDFKVEVQLDGVFSASETTPILIRPESWGELSVLTAVPHGKRVKKDTTLVELDTKKIDIAIADAEAQVAAELLGIQSAEAALRLSKKSVPLSLATARRSASESKENLDRFRRIGRSRSIKDIEFSVTSSRNSLAYQLEELDQLEKMYKADDLTEETEEIILTRARNNVKAYQHQLESVILRRDRFLKTGLPRQEADLVQLVDQSTLGLEEAEATLPSSLTAKTLELEKLGVGHGKTKENLARLRRDRELMNIVAPRDGIVYYGQPSHGKWTEIATLEKALRRGGAVKGNQVLMTIVSNDSLVVLTSVDEKNLHEVAAGADVEIVPTAFPNEKFRGRLSELAAIPTTQGKFAATIKLTGESSSRIVAGMGCKATIETYHQASAILVPKSAVAKGDGPNQGHVRLVKEDGSTEKRNVKTGRHSGDRVEIVDGLKAGESILTEVKD